VVFIHLVKTYIQLDILQIPQECVEEFGGLELTFPIKKGTHVDAFYIIAQDVIEFLQRHYSSNNDIRASL